MSGPNPRRKRGGKDLPPKPGPSGRGGGRNRRPGRGGGDNSSRYRSTTAAVSPLQLPHVKVTIRNIVGDEHASVVGVVDSVREFLNRAFGSDGNQTVDEGSAYMMAWHKEKEEFEMNKAMLDSAAAANGGSTQSISLGWAYEEKIAPLVLDGLLPSPEAIANAVERSALDGKAKQMNIHSTIESAMSQMMNECGKSYLNYVGGRVTFDEESAVGVTLVEKIAAEQKKIQKNKIETEVEAVDESLENGAADKKSTVQEDRQVEQLTQQMEKLNTGAKPTNQPSTTVSPSTRIRILSITPVKNSKRRGNIGARVELVLYPPDPCLIFKDGCREAGRIAAERYVSASMKKVDAALAKSEGVTNNEDMAPEDAYASNKKGSSPLDTIQPTTLNQQTIPPIPSFPRLSPAERSRATARSRILMNRTIEAMKIHAKSKSFNTNFQGWEIFESTSQKTWKGQPQSMVSALMAGASLNDLLVEKESTNDEDKKVRRGNARGDRYDSTIENSEDYKLFMETWKNGGSVPAAINKSTGTKSAVKEEEKLDEEGRPLSAVVNYLQSKREEEARAKAEAAAAAARARAVASAAAAREKARKKELEAKTRKAKARMKRDEERKKKANGGKVMSRPGSASSGGVAPPPGAVLLKKGAGAIPTDGFNSK